MISSNSLLEMRESSSSGLTGAGAGALSMDLVLNCQGSGLFVVVVLVVALTFVLVGLLFVGIDSKPVAITVTLIVSSSVLSNAAPQMIVASG